jgi:PAS domain S-box-containing protein
MNEDRLREEAERILNIIAGEGDPLMPDPDKNLHELRVYQIELELQNEELKRSSEEILKSHKRFTDLFELAPVGYLVLSDDFTILNVNLSACMMLHTEKSMMQNKTFTRFIQPECQDNFHFFIQKVLQADQLLTIDIRLHNEEHDFDAQLQALRDYDAGSGSNLIRLVLMDISRRKLMEKELKRFRVALDSTGDNIFLIHHQSLRIIDVNDSAAANLGYKRHQLLNLSPGDVVPEFTTQAIKSFRDTHLANQEDNITIEKTYIQKDGRVVYMELYLKTVIIDEEKIIVVVARDITERKRTQDKLALYAKELEELNSGKDRFLSIISHDLRGPFLGLKGYTQMLLEEYDMLSKEEIMEYLRKVFDSSNDLYTLVDNLLKWSRLELGKIPYEPMAFNLFQEMESLMKLLNGIAEKKEITLENNIPREIYPFADRLMLISIIQNLVGNAIKFTRKKGRVTITAYETDNNIMVSVADNGVGMSAEVMEKLFTLDKGFTSRGTAGEKGTGFGLIITKEMIKKMGGDIFIESDPLKGSTFSFSLKRAIRS